MLISLNFLGWMHPKNIEGAQLLNNMNIEFNGQSRDVVINSSQINGVMGNITIYGPSIDLLNISLINDYPVNLLSQWNIDCLKILNPKSNAIALPFPINIERFRPSIKDKIPIVYFKRRSTELLKDVIDFLSYEYKEIRFFNYDKGYKESEYIDAISKAPFCVWIGCHESQGFALQECLSSNTPIFVIDVDSMCDEISSNGDKSWDSFWMDKKAKTAPYFDERCGIITNVRNWKNDFILFISNINLYKPREYIIDNLSPTILTNVWKNYIDKCKK